MSQAPLGPGASGRGGVHTITVAAAQFACALDEDAARRGVHLLLVPELMPGGYTLSESIWKTMEPFEGPTVTWMKALSDRLHIHVGTTFLEAEGEDFYYTFVLTAPDGTIAGKVRKRPAASFEAYFFRGGGDPQGFDTRLGRTGVGFCFEYAIYERYCETHAAQVDLYLRSPCQSLFRAKFPIRNSGTAMLNAAPRVGTVTLDPARKAKEKAPALYGRWTAKMPWWAVTWILTQKLGERAHRKSGRRRARARTAALHARTG